MGNRYQPLRGNPENKLMIINSDFSGGVNLVYSDDALKDNELRYAVNFTLNNKGELRQRKGFSKHTALTELLFSYAGAAQSAFPILGRDAVTSPVSEIVYMKLIENNNNAWKNLSTMESLAAYQTMFGAEQNRIKLFILCKLLDGSTKYWVNSYTINVGSVTRTTASGTLAITMNVKDNLQNIAVGEQYGTIYFTNNNKGLVSYDAVTNTFKYVGDFTVNEAYKPTGIELRRIGFNVLGTDPLTWSDNSSLTTESIQGVFLTTPPDANDDRIPLDIIPTGSPIQVNIIHTGDLHDFTIEFLEGETTIEATVSKDTELSTTAIAVYNVEFLTQPNYETELHVKFTSETVFLQDYIDYYNTGSLDKEAKPVQSLNVGDYNIVQMYDRLVYYKGNEIWFSDVNTFDYVPNYNYILLPIDSDDEIVKIKFFRTNYIVFTEKKIFKLSGNFESTSLQLDTVSEDVGCIAPNTVKVVNNSMYFLSTRGLRVLVSDRFKDNLENIAEFDEPIAPLITKNKRAYAIVADDQYMLFANTRGVVNTVEVRGRDYTVPDVVSNYYKMGPFSIYQFAEDSYPRYIFEEGGELFSFMSTYSSGTALWTTQMYKFGAGYDDFGVYSNTVFETAGLSLGYPTHEKKFKNVIFKMGVDTDINNVYVEIYSDGIKQHDTQIDYDDGGDALDLESSRFVLTKEKLPAKCKNLGVRVEVVDAIGVSLQSLAYIFKLGKVRDTR